MTRCRVIEGDTVFNVARVICAQLIVVLSSSCANDTAPLSPTTQQPVAEEQAADAPISNARIAEEPEKAIAEAIPAPKEWPTCWLSARLSSTEAVVKERSKHFTADQGRQEFRGKSANPITSGDCVINWFGQDNPDEPWVEMMEQYFSRSTHPYDSIVTCTADSTPDCTCMTTLPKDPGGDPLTPYDNVPFIVGDCVRETDAGRLAIYNVRNPEQRGLQPANGRCNVANASIARVLIEKRADIVGLDEDTDVTLTDDQTCHVDIEPFNPRDDEKDWYGNEIRDWAVVRCEDEATSCRSYALFYKSGEDQNVRGSMTEQGLMLICNRGTCKQVWEESN